MLGSVRHAITVPNSVDQVWDIIGDPAALASWLPDFSVSTVDGVTRTITTASGLTFDEELLVVDPLQHRIQYRVNLPMLQFHRGTLDVVATGEHSCVVSYATDAEPRLMALVISAPTFRGLEYLKKLLEEKYG